MRASVVSDVNTAPSPYFLGCKSRAIMQHPLPRTTMVEVNLLCFKGPLKMLSVIIIIAK